MSLNISEDILVINVVFLCVYWLCPVPGDSLGDIRRSVLINIRTKKYKKIWKEIENLENI